MAPPTASLLMARSLLSPSLRALSSTSSASVVRLLEVALAAGGGVIDDVDGERAHHALLLADGERGAQMARLHVGAAQVVDHAERGGGGVERVEAAELGGGHFARLARLVAEAAQRRGARAATPATP